MPSDAQRANRSAGMEVAYPLTQRDPFEPDVYQQGKAIQRTDPADPNAVAQYDAEPNTPNNKTQTNWVRE